jgi:hypothetical protein
MVAWPDQVDTHVDEAVVEVEADQRRPHPGLPQDGRADEELDGGQRGRARLAVVVRGELRPERRGQGRRDDGEVHKNDRHLHANKFPVLAASTLRAVDSSIECAAMMYPG